MAKAKRAGYKMPSGMLVQAPWGKHNPVTWRLHHQAAVGGVGFNHAEFLPIVMIKVRFYYSSILFLFAYPLQTKITFNAFYWSNSSGPYHLDGQHVSPFVRGSLESQK